MKKLLIMASAVCLGGALFAVNRTNVVEGMTVVIFDEVGTCEFVPDEDIASAELFLVGGGGGGGGRDGGGGGGGEVRDITEVSLTAGETYTVTVGAGGLGAAASGNTDGNCGKNGESSTFAGDDVTYEALGGGRGGGGWDVYVSGQSLNGANGGGAGGNGTSVKDGGSPTAENGHKGGSSGSGGGGGGGMAEDGCDAKAAVTPRRGGAGIVSKIIGVEVMYGAGGSGGNEGDRVVSVTGDGYGDGAGKIEGVSVAATSARPGTGNGGGGASQSYVVGGNGGSGVVVIRYQSAKKMPAEFDLVPYTGWADGNPHSVTVIPVWPAEYTLEYSLNGTDSFSPELPQITEVGSNEVFVAMSGPTCERTVKSAVVWLVSPEGRLLNIYDATGDHVFTTPARLVADVLVVGGGGSGAGYGGGGGGGFVIYKQGLFLPAGERCEITVGAGGESVDAYSGKSGKASSFVVEDLAIDYTAPGGGAGGGGWSNANGGAGANGGGAGGNGSEDKTRFYPGGAATVEGGHKGGDMLGTEQGQGAGGGGMAEDGKSVAEGGDGGAGWVIDITGTPIMYGAGGGGNSRGKGGSGDGSGDSGNSSAAAKPGNPNTGCGGGGAYYQRTSGAGGSGVVVLRYAYLDEVPPTIDDGLQCRVFEDNSLRITGKISYLGSGANSCTVTYYVGTNPDALAVIGSDEITESGVSFEQELSGLQESTVYYWKVTAESNVGSSSSSGVRHNWSYGKWHYADGVIDNGMWKFNATDDGNGNLTVGTCVLYPQTPRILDFGREVVNASGEQFAIATLDPQFSLPKDPGNSRSDAIASAYATALGELVLPSEGLTTIRSFAFAMCTALTNVVNLIPDTVTELGYSAFTLDAKLTGDVKLLGLATIRENVFSYSGVNSVRFGPGLKNVIGWSSDGCFQNCANLTNVTFDAATTGAGFSGEHSHFAGCGKLEGTLDLRGFTGLNAANGNGPFPGTKYGEFLLGDGENMTLSREFFNGSSVTSIVFEGVPPKTLGVPYLGALSNRLVTTYVYRKNKAKPNSKGMCWLDYATDRVINGKSSTWAQDGTIITVDSALRPLLTVEPDGLMLIVK